ncbi:hypothetical protein ACIBHX_21975 [Nonomuraea sp. NPDC050536]|uniref:hypothetical protein n=1 Tax=Nonomuraea sp. NPDC050536 TaxID=3364366 RepID=UPI0037C6E61E
MYGAATVDPHDLASVVRRAAATMDPYDLASAVRRAAATGRPRYSGSGPVPGASGESRTLARRHGVS